MGKAKRCIYLPALNKRISLGAYVCAIKTAKANPEQEFKTGLTTWWPTTGAEIVEQFRRGMNDRINQAVPYNRRGVS